MTNSNTTKHDPRLIQSLIQPIMANNQPKIPEKKTNTNRILPQNADNNTTYGDNIESTTKHHTTLRLYHQNIRGAKQYFSWDSWTQGHHQLQQWKVDIATHVETNTYWNYQNISTAQNIAKKQHTQVHLNTSCSTEPSTTRLPTRRNCMQCPRDNGQEE